MGIADLVLYGPPRSASRSGILKRLKLLKLFLKHLKPGQLWITSVLHTLRTSGFRLSITGHLHSPSDDQPRRHLIYRAGLDGALHDAAAGAAPPYCRFEGGPW